MDLSDEELKATKNRGKMDIKQAMKILENKSDYLVPNSDIDEALDTLIDYLKNLMRKCKNE